MMNEIILLLRKNERLILLIALTSLSVASFIYFFQKDQLLLYVDALSRLNISRKIIDNLTPGLAQLGNVWLPLPHLLMLPFVTNNYLWHSGIAGSIISMISYIIGGVYLYKSARILFQSYLTPVLGLSVYALNINLLYLQTTAMSETIFLASVSASIYYFIKWIKSGHKMHYLIIAGLAINVTTLIRYEGLALLLSAIPMVFLYVLYKTRNHYQAESSTILFAALASLGFLFWTIYLTTIFGDPFYWKNFYAGGRVAEDGGITYGEQKSFIEAVWVYTTSVLWMNGLIPTVLAFLALPLFAFKTLKEKSFYFLPVLLSTSIFLFMILTLMRNTPIYQPDLTLATILNPSTFNYPEFNIRYGILMLPMITLLCSYLFTFRFFAVKVLVLALLCAQFLSYIYPGIVLIFQMPINISSSITQSAQKENDMTDWLRQNYNNEGLIMISDLKHGSTMLKLGVPYKTYIHEGANKYWLESIKHPQKYASWVVMDTWLSDDQVTKYLKDSPELKLYFNRVYENDGMYIYKIKTKPDVIIK